MVFFFVVFLVMFFFVRLHFFRFVVVFVFLVFVFLVAFFFVVFFVFFVLVVDFFFQVFDGFFDVFQAFLRFHFFHEIHTRKNFKSRQPVFNPSQDFPFVSVADNARFPVHVFMAYGRHLTFPSFLVLPLTR